MKGRLYCESRRTALSRCFDSFSNADLSCRYSSYQIVDDRLDKRAAAMADKEASIQAIEQDMAKLVCSFVTLVLHTLPG